MRIFLAGCELEHWARLVTMTGHKYALLSYYHLMGDSPEENQKAFKLFRDNEMEIILDSGLFTMMFGAGKGKTYDMAFMKDYAAKYIEKAKTFGLSKLTIVEADVHKLLGMDAVFELREQFEKSGMNVLYVWHREEGIPGLIAMAKKYPYIALSVPELRKLFKGRDERYQTAVYDLLGRIRREVPKMPKIHLLGNTVEETMKTTLAYSCDSTSWLAGSKYGESMLFSNGRLVKANVRSQTFAEVKANIFRDQELCRQIETLTTKPSFVEYLKNAFVSAWSYAQYQYWLDRNFKWIGDTYVQPSSNDPR